MIYFARYYRVFKAIRDTARQEWSGASIHGLQPTALGEKSPQGRRWDPPYAPQERPSEPSQKPSGT